MLIADMYPSHLPETLLALRFDTWADEEKRAVVDCLSAVESFLDLSCASDREEWHDALTALGG
jgi:hypothetical protein